MGRQNILMSLFVMASISTLACDALKNSENNSEHPVECQYYSDALNNALTEAMTLSGGPCKTNEDCTLTPSNPLDICGTGYRPALNQVDYASIKDLFTSATAGIAEQCPRPDITSIGCTGVWRPSGAACDTIKQLCRPAYPGENNP